MGDDEESHEAKSHCVASPPGLMLPLRTALVDVMLVADNVVAVGAGARITGTIARLRKNRMIIAFCSIFMLCSPPLCRVADNPK